MSLLIFLSLLLPLPDGNYAALSGDSTAIVAGTSKTVMKEAVVEFPKMRINPLEKVSDFQFSPDVSRILLTRAAGDTAQSPFYIYKVESRRCDRLSDNPDQKAPVFSPDGKKIAYVRGNNVIIKRLEYNTEIQVTQDGSDSIYNGVRCRDMREAFDQEALMVWAPGSDYLVFSKNERLYMYSMQYKWTKEVKMPDPDAAYITAVEWSSDPEMFGVIYLNKEQTKLRMAKVNAATFVAKRIYEYTDSKYILPECATFLKFADKTHNFMVLRPENDRVQLCLFSPLGKFVKQITSASADVTTVYRYDFAARRIWYQTFDGSVRSECQILSDGSKPVTLSSESVQKSGREYGESGDLSYYVVKPDNMSKSTPLVMYVTDFESDESDAFENAMRWRGVMTAVVKCRGTEGQGVAFRQAAYLDMLNAPAQDYAKVAAEIAAKYGIDSSNISIVGEDINAGVALSAILAADSPFRAAVAVSPVTDLRNYNPVVTQRLMRTSGATSAYRMNSAVDNASKLEKKLLILHSAGDDVTPLSNTEALCNALVDSGVQFDMQVFFSGGRGMTSGLANNYTVTKIYNYIK